MAILSFGLLSTIYVNPLYKGVDILTDTDIAIYIRETSQKDDSKWIVYGNHYYAQYALANNANVINGIHMYPQFKIWEILDPQKKHADIYNRYAHVMVSEYDEGENLVNLTAMDTIELNIDPCDDKLKELKVKYVLSSYELSKTCLIKMKQFDSLNVYIYELN